MENRTIASTPSSDQRPPNSKADDFDPPPSSGGPIVEDKPVPPGSYDVETAPPAHSSGAVKK